METSLHCSVLRACPWETLFPYCTLKTTQEKEMQDEVMHRRKLCMHFTGILGFKERRQRNKLTANGEKLKKLKTKVRQEKAYGGCLGVQRRRRTRQAAKSHGERQAGNEPWISEWGNPAGAIPSSRKGGHTRRTETSK